MMNRVRKIWVVVALVAGAVLTSVGARADMIVEMDNADTSATVFGSGCFLSTFRILYQGDNYLACEGVGGAESRGLIWDMANAPRESGGGFFYENGGLHCIYAKWADGAARWNNTRYQIDWNFSGSFFPDISIGVDQQRNGGQWVRLACSTAPIAGSRAAVKCSNFGIPVGRYAICDGIKVVREQVDRTDILDEPGYEVSQRSSIAASGLANCSLPSSSWTTLATVTLTTPRNYGIVWVHANGVSKHNNDGTARVCIAATSGCTSNAPILDQSSTEVAEGTWDNETRWTVSDTFPATGGGQTFRLKGCRGGGSASDVDLFWDDFVGLYFPSNY